MVQSKGMTVNFRDPGKLEPCQPRFASFDCSELDWEIRLREREIKVRLLNSQAPFVEDPRKEQVRKGGLPPPVD